MRRVARLVLVIGFGIVFLLPSDLMASIDTNIWDQEITVIDEGIISNSEAQYGPNCEIESINTREVRGGIARYADGKIIEYDFDDETPSSAFSECVYRTDIGSFGGGRYYSPNNIADRYLTIEPGSASGVSYHPAPNSRAVMMAVRSGSGLQIGFTDRLDKIGQLDYSSRNYLYHDLQWKLTEQIDTFRYTDGSDVISNGFAYSGNGSYMVMRFGNMFARIRLSDMSMTPFYYADNVSSQFYLGISGDGRYATTINSNQLHVHDLQNCSTSYLGGEWQQYSGDFEGCSSSGDLSSKIIEVLPSHYTLQRIEFNRVGSEFTVSAGKSTGRWSYQWNKVRISTDNYTTPELQGYLAMGDSYSSGEGDLRGGDWYEPGTDDQGDKSTFLGRNLCHLSRRSYPYLIAKSLGYIDNLDNTPSSDGLFHSVACSGAKIHNVIGGLGEVQEDASAGDFAVADNQYRYLGDYDLGFSHPGTTSQQLHLSERTTPLNEQVDMITSTLR